MNTGEVQLLSGRDHFGGSALETRLPSTGATKSNSSFEKENEELRNYSYIQCLLGSLEK